MKITPLSDKINLSSRVSSSGVCVNDLCKRAALLIEGGPFCFMCGSVDSSCGPNSSSDPIEMAGMGSSLTRWVTKFLKGLLTSEIRDTSVLMPGSHKNLAVPNASTNRVLVNEPADRGRAGGDAAASQRTTGINRREFVKVMSKLEVLRET